VGKTRFLVETHLQTKRPIAELVRSHGVDKSWLYRAVKRYRREGEAGLVARSRRPHSSPTRISDRYEDEIVALRKELLDAGYDSRPYHPQTQGKVERFHQTIKKFLAKQTPATTKKQLQTQLDSFVAYYNEVRPHRGIGRKTPLEVFNAREKTFPSGPLIDAAGYRVRHDKVDRGGNVTLRYRGELHHIGIGRAYAGWRVVLLVVGRDVRIFATDGSPLRHLTLDPSTNYQRQP
jgi:hypothetical protein